MVMVKMFRITRQAALKEIGKLSFMSCPLLRGRRSSLPFPPSTTKKAGRWLEFEEMAGAFVVKFLRRSGGPV
jgi:hypothetical protein